MPLTYITATPDTVTPPESLITLFDEYFQYFARKGHVEPSDAEQVRPILDLINYDYSLLSGDSGLQGANNDLHLLGSIAGLPPVATLAARYRFMQEVYGNNSQKDGIPAALTGEMLTQFAKALPSYPIRTLSYGLDALELGNIPSTCHGGFISTTILEVELPHVPTKQIQMTALATLADMTLKAAVEAEWELADIRKRLETLSRSLRKSELYSEEVAQEITYNVE